jgi:uncharacterized protein
MGRTALNVSGSMVSGIFTSKVTGNLNKEVFSNPKEQLGTQDMQG